MVGFNFENGSITESRALKVELSDNEEEPQIFIELVFGEDLPEELMDNTLKITMKQSQEDSAALCGTPHSHYIYKANYLLTILHALFTIPDEDHNFDDLNETTVTVSRKLNELHVHGPIKIYCQRQDEHTVSMEVTDAHLTDISGALTEEVHMMESKIPIGCYSNPKERKSCKSFLYLQ